MDSSEGLTRDTCQEPEESDTDEQDEINFEDESSDTDSEMKPRVADFERVQSDCMTRAEVEGMFLSTARHVQNAVQVPLIGTAYRLLRYFNWDSQKAIEEYLADPPLVLKQARVRVSVVSADDTTYTGHNVRSGQRYCLVCQQNLDTYQFCSAGCGHHFCVDCWKRHVETQIETEGRPGDIFCMDEACDVLAPRELVLQLISANGQLKERYLQFTLNEWICSHPHLRFCPGKDCQAVIKANEHQAKKVICECCGTQFCWLCGYDYHAPATCDTIKKWIIQCTEDSKTAKYIMKYTKDCPNCNRAIERNGGCPHMACTKCGFQFCWNCLTDLNLCKCGSGEISKSKHARAALGRYLFYFSRWENHARSLRLEEANRRTLSQRIYYKNQCGVQGGTFTDWNKFIEAADILAKCRYTLQYTYPYVFYLEEGSQRRNLIEFQLDLAEELVTKLSEKLQQTDLQDLAFICRLTKKLTEWRRKFANEGFSLE